MFSDSFENELARQIYMRDGLVKLTKPLFLARPEIALRGNDDLDELDAIHVKVLACVCENENVKNNSISIAIGIKEEDVKDYLHSLYLCNYVDQNFKPTSLGKKIIFEVGIEVLKLDKYYMKGALEETERLLKYHIENY